MSGNYLFVVFVAAILANYALVPTIGSRQGPLSLGQELNKPWPKPGLDDDIRRPKPKLGGAPAPAPTHKPGLDDDIRRPKPKHGGAPAPAPTHKPGLDDDIRRPKPKHGGAPAPVPTRKLDDDDKAWYRNCQPKISPLPPHKWKQFHDDDDIMQPKPKHGGAPASAQTRKLDSDDNYDKAWVTNCHPRIAPLPPQNL